MCLPSFRKDTQRVMPRLCTTVCVCLCIHRDVMFILYTHLHGLINYCGKGYGQLFSIITCTLICLWLVRESKVEVTHYRLCSLVELCLCVHGAAGYKVLFTNACMPSVSTAAEREEPRLLQHTPTMHMVITL